MSPGARDAMPDYNTISPADMEVAQLTEVVSFLSLSHECEPKCCSLNTDPVNALADHAQEYFYYY